MVVVLCIFEHVQWTQALNGRLARGHRVQGVALDPADKFRAFSNSTY